MSIIFSYSRNISQWIQASSKALTLSWWRFLLYRNQSIYFSSNQWTGFRIIGTSVMKDSRRYSPTYTKSLFLHVAKHNLLLLFFFYLAFLSRMFTIHRTAGEWEGEGRRGGGYYLLIVFVPLLCASQTLRRWFIAAESSHLRICGSLAAGIFVTRSLEFTLSTLALVAAVVRKMLKTWVTLGNISRVLLNLTKRLIFVMFKDSSSFSLFT